ncbi:MAG: hypothetical protein AB7T37_15075 [Dehalococcoidia bacterium]
MAGLVVGNPRRIDRIFACLAEKWREETGGLSSPSKIAANESYQAIIDLGPEVVPLILQDLREYGGFWFPALRQLTGESPVPESARGNVELMREHWLRWWEQNEYAV